MGKIVTLKKKNILRVRADRHDARDFVYPARPSLLPLEVFSTYTKKKIPILDQGNEGACTGYGLATCVNYYLHMRKQTLTVDAESLYKNAKKNDEWDGENYDGSSCRGALNGFWKEGAVTADGEYKVSLGSFYRVNAKDVHEMHLALVAEGVLYVSSNVHRGWDKPSVKGEIAFDKKVEGGHSFAIIGYDESGFWIQNSWGGDYGKKGYVHITYEDWLFHGYDCWVICLAVSNV